jgi:hypothetical protein
MLINIWCREIATILAYEATKDAFTIREIGEV